MRSRDNNQFKIAHAFPGLCSLCFKEVGEFNGSNEYGYPIVARWKGNLRRVRVELNDSMMTVHLCASCEEIFSRDDLRDLMESEINGWIDQAKRLVVRKRWTREKANNYVRHAKKRYAINRVDKPIRLNIVQRLLPSKPRSSKLENL